MRNRQTIEREIYRAREDLEDSIAQLKHVVQEKVDVKARARVAVEKGKMAAHDAIEAGKTRAQDMYARGVVGAKDLASRGKDGARDLAFRGKDGAIELYGKAKDRPVLVGAIAGGIVAIGALAYIGRQRDWW
jgi:hypothetical protein